MRLVVGLGNPGERYARTPHNAGFDVVIRLAADIGCSLKRSPRLQAVVGRGTLGAEPVILAMPETFMNESGRAVVAVLNYFGADPGGLLVVVDDADLPLGRMRIRPKGGTGGHRGLASIIEQLGSDDFPRVRLGIGRDERGAGLIDHVLKPMAATDRERMDRVVEQAVRAVRMCIEAGTEAAMNSFNGRADLDAPGDSGSERPECR